MKTRRGLFGCLQPTTMLPSPSSSPRPILHNRTNFNPLERKPQKLQQTLSFLPTPPKCRTLKRPLKAVDDVQRKRPKVDDSDMREENDSDSEQSACGSDAPPSVAPVRRRPTTIRGLTHRSGDGMSCAIVCMQRLT